LEDGLVSIGKKFLTGIDERGKDDEKHATRWEMEEKRRTSRKCKRRKCLKKRNRGLWTDCEDRAVNRMEKVNDQREELSILKNAARKENAKLH